MRPERRRGTILGSLLITMPRIFPGVWSSLSKHQVRERGSSMRGFSHALHISLSPGFLQSIRVKPHRSSSIFVSSQSPKRKAMMSWGERGSVPSIGAVGAEDLSASISLRDRTPDSRSARLFPNQYFPLWSSLHRQGRRGSTPDSVVRRGPTSPSSELKLKRLLYVPQRFRRQSSLSTGRDSEKRLIQRALLGPVP